MKVFKNKKGTVLATLNEKAVWISDLEGNIYKKIPIEKFNFEKFKEGVNEFPCDFEEAMSMFQIADAAKRARKKRKPDYSEIGGASLIVVWSWQKHVGYCRKLEGVYSAAEYDIKTEEDLITGNEDRVNRQNFSVLIPAHKLEDYCHGAKYDNKVADMIADALNDDKWRWQFFQKFDADFVKENLSIEFFCNSEEY